MTHRRHPASAAAPSLWAWFAFTAIALSTVSPAHAAGDGQVAEHYSLRLLNTVPDHCPDFTPQLSANGRYLAGTSWQPPTDLDCGPMRSALQLRRAQGTNTRLLKADDGEALTALAVSTDGRAAGGIRQASGSEQAFVTGPLGEGLQRLSGLDSTQAQARAVNRRGQVAGVARAANGWQRAFVTAPLSGTMLDLGTLGGHESWAQAINDQGRVVGYSQTTPGSARHQAFLSAADGSGLMDLGSLGPYGSMALAVNRHNQVVGISYYDPTLYIAKGFITDAEGRNPRLIQPLDDVSQFSAVGLNAHGQVVGASFTRVKPGQPWAEVHAIVTGPQGVGTVDLNDRVSLPGGQYLSAAFSISDEGDILATSTDFLRHTRSWWLLCRQTDCRP